MRNCLPKSFSNAALGIEHVRLDPGQPWRTYIESHLSIQRRMADWDFSQAHTWPELDGPGLPAGHLHHAGPIGRRSVTTVMNGAKRVDRSARLRLP
jgi:hypothetical protein